MYRKVYFDSLPSTNTFLKQNYKNYEDKTVIICDSQTQGHGRLGRSWESSTDNIALSILLKPQISVDSISRLSLMTSAVIFEVINKLTNNVLIKWPNDILVNSKKVSGILLESIISSKVEALIIGIGVNVNQASFSEDLNKKATSLYLETNTKYNKMTIIDDIITTFDKFYRKYLSDKHNYLDICRWHSAIISRNISVNNEDVYVLDIKDNGALLVRDANGLINEIAYGEVSLTNEYKNVD